MSHQVSMTISRSRLCALLIRRVITITRKLLSWANRQRMILIVHFRLDTISSANVSSLLGGVVTMQTHFFPVLPLDEIVLAYNAQHFARNYVATLQLVLLAPETSLTALPFRLARYHVVGSHRRVGQTKTEHETTRHEGHEFGIDNGYHEGPPRVRNKNTVRLIFTFTRLREYEPPGQSGSPGYSTRVLRPVTK